MHKRGGGGGVGWGNDPALRRFAPAGLERGWNVLGWGWRVSVGGPGGGADARPTLPPALASEKSNPPPDVSLSPTDESQGLCRLCCAIYIFKICSVLTAKSVCGCVCVCVCVYNLT